METYKIYILKLGSLNPSLVWDPGLPCPCWLHTLLERTIETYKVNILRIRQGNRVFSLFWDPSMPSLFYYTSLL